MDELYQQLGEQTSNTHGLMATTQVAKLDDHGAILMPSGITHVFVEIGCNNRDTLDEQILENKAAYAHSRRGFLISFEPLIEKYAGLLVRAGPRFFGRLSRDRSLPLGHHHPYGVVLPFAVAPSAGQKVFSVSQVAGCSSIMPTSNSSFANFCMAQREERTVPAINLSSAIALAGRRPIRFLKIDAQGVDFDIVRATPKHQLANIQSLQLELWRDSDHCRGRAVYGARWTCSEVVAYMRQVGFRLAGHASDTRPSQANNLRLIRRSLCEDVANHSSQLCEWNAIFANIEGKHKPLDDNELVLLPNN